MIKCKNCYHENLCKFTNEGVMKCRNFKDKSLIAKLPCKIGDVLFTLDSENHDIDNVICDNIEFHKCGISIYCQTIYGIYDTYVPSDFGESIFLSYEDAEKALEA